MNREQVDILQPLNPADYFTLAMDEEIRRENMPGSLCCFALELDRQPDVAELCARIVEFRQKFPLASASLQQRGKRYYWCLRREPKQIFFQHHCPPQQDEAVFFQTTVSQIINHHEARETLSPLEFHLISGPLKHTFLLRWLHPACDARGADLILKYLCTETKEQRDLFDQPKIASLTNVQLSKFKWWQNIYFFFKANRYINQIDRYLSIQHGQLQEPPKRLNCLNFKLTVEQSATIAQQSRLHTGLTGTSLYYIGCLMRALYRLDPHATGEAYCVPYAYNLRKLKALTPVLGNHLGALFAQAPKTLLDNREQLFTHLKQQNARVIRQQLDYAFLPVMRAASWLSLKKYGEELRKSYKTGMERSSFWFSDIGQPEFSERSFFSADVTGLFHLCQLSSPPGLGFLICKYRQQLTLSYNFTEPLFNETWIRQLHELMTEELLG